MRYQGKEHGKISSIVCPTIVDPSSSSLTLSSSQYAFLYVVDFPLAVWLYHDVALGYAMILYADLMAKKSSVNLRIRLGRLGKMIPSGDPYRGHFCTRYNSDSKYSQCLRNDMEVRGWRVLF